jgi:hypothetical protein
MNPYETPAKSGGNLKPARLSIGVMLIVMLIGGLVGSYVWGPSVRENATPAPYVVAFAFAALLVLVFLLLSRFVLRVIRR